MGFEPPKDSAIVRVAAHGLPEGNVVPSEGPYCDREASGRRRISAAVLAYGLLLLAACASVGGSGSYYCEEVPPGGESVRYSRSIVAATSPVGEDRIELIDGSAWTLSDPPSVGPAAGSDVLVVAEDIAHGPFTAYFSLGDSTGANYAGGTPSWRSGWLTEVTEVSSDGQFFRTAGGAAYEVKELDRSETRLWIPTTAVLIDRSNLLAYALENLREIGVFRLCPGVSPNQM